MKTETLLAKLDAYAKSEFENGQISVYLSGGVFWLAVTTDKGRRTFAAVGSPKAGLKRCTEDIKKQAEMS